MANTSPSWAIATLICGARQTKIDVIFTVTVQVNVVVCDLHMQVFVGVLLVCFDVLSDTKQA